MPQFGRKRLQQAAVAFVQVDDLSGEQVWNIVLTSDGKVVSTIFRPK